jgi:hypothetical protein
LGLNSERQVTEDKVKRSDFARIIRQKMFNHGVDLQQNFFLLELDEIFSDKKI